MSDAVTARPVRSDRPERTGLLLLAIPIITLLAEWIGPLTLPLGKARIVLLPMLTALLMTTLLAFWQARLPSLLRFDLPLQRLAERLLNIALLLFIVKLGLMAGAKIEALREVGWALAFQELGHAFGTMVLALPLALLLGIKREAVGATFSIGRETGMVIIGQRYGMQSAEGRGVLAEYITGTVLGAIFVSILASLIMAMDIFDLRALAMGAGIGSGSMMAAALGPIVAGQDPELERELTAIAGAANLIAGVVGFYFAAYITLPLCNTLYTCLEPILGRTWLARRAPSTADPELHADEEAQTGSSHGDKALALLLMLIGISLSNWIGHGIALQTTLPGVAIMLGIVALGLVLRHVLRHLPLMLFLAVFSTLLTLPAAWPLADRITALVEPVQFMSLTPPVLALAGFSVARKLPVFRRLGWRIVLVSLTATSGAFIGSATVAELFH